MAVALICVRFGVGVVSSIVPTKKFPTAEVRMDTSNRTYRLKRYRNLRSGAMHETTLTQHTSVAQKSIAGGAHT